MRFAGTLVAVGVAFSVGLLVGWHYRSLQQEAIVSKQALADYTALVNRVEATAQENDRLAAANDKALESLKEKQDETNTLRSAVAAGTRRLRVSAICPAAVETSTSPEVDTPASAELAPDAGQAYFALRDAIVQVEAQLAACQWELRVRTGQD